MTRGIKLPRVHPPQGRLRRLLWAIWCSILGLVAVLFAGMFLLWPIAMLLDGESVAHVAVMFGGVTSVVVIVVYRAVRMVEREYDVKVFKRRTRRDADD